jgi:predicted alpha/beta superfamily hydrolase
VLIRIVALCVTTLVSVAVALAAVGQRGLGLDARLHSEFTSKHLASPRQVIVWLPPGYATDKDSRYPVLYMHDGQNVYIEWRIDDIAKPLIAAKEIEPLIIVMIANDGTPESRANDYTWTKQANARAGGGAENYARMLVEELKPFIDKEYRTRSDAASTGVGGASFGGIVSLHLGLKYPEVFGRLAVMSPSVWWDNKVIVRDVQALKTRTPARIWLDVGASERDPMPRNAKELRDALTRKGWKVGTDLTYYELPNGTHDEESFARRAADMLKFLFPAK